MRVMKRAVLENVIIFDKKDLSVNGLGISKYSGHFSLVDFIIKDRTFVLAASLVLYDDGHILKFVKSNIGKTIEDYNTFQKHIHEMNKLQIVEIAELKKKEDVVVDEEELDNEVDISGVVFLNEAKKLEEKSEQRNKTAKSNKKVRKGKDNPDSSRSTRRIKQKQL